MNILKRKKKSGLCPTRLTLALLAAGLILLLRALRGSHELMVWLSGHFVRPILRALGEKSAGVPFSVAELLIVCAVLGLLLYLWFFLEGIFRRGQIFRRIYRLLVTLLCFALLVYAGFSLLWGVYFYGDDFMAQSGLPTEEITNAQLKTVTEYFAILATESATGVPRDENGVCASDRERILEHSAELYAGLERDFPCLQGPPLPAKPIRLSRLLSYTDFTGFFFPFTGEANVNTDFPPAFFASTVAHELAHQRGVAKEQEANFVAVLACLRDGDPDYVYSAALLAYTHLGNALAEADRESWETVYAELSDLVRNDLEAERSYWARFDTAVQTVSNTVYENFMYSYDQTLGLRSYGACVDLLVNYYYDIAVQYLEAMPLQEALPTQGELPAQGELPVPGEPPVQAELPAQEDLP